MIGNRIEALRDALCEAFTLQTLEEMLRFRLDKVLPVIVATDALATVVYNLIMCWPTAKAGCRG